jgi:LysM repeat protein
MNDGLVIGIEGPPVVTGGNPWPFTTMVGLNAQIHRVTNGQTLQMVAEQFHGPGASPSALAAANPHVPMEDIHAPIMPGTSLAIPPAVDRAAVTPGGPGGSGVGGGSVTNLMAAQARSTAAHGQASSAHGGVPPRIQASAVNTRAKGPH